MFFNIKSIFVFTLTFIVTFVLSFATASDFIFAQAIKSREELKADLALLEAEIEGQRSLLNGKQRESVTLERDIAILDAKIRKAELSIKARNISVNELSNDIRKKNLTIEELTEKMDREKESLAQLIRKTDEADNISLIEIILGSQNLSEFFLDVDSFSAIKGALKESFQVIEDVQTSAAVEKEQLLDKLSEEQELKNIQVLEQQRIAEDESKKRQILNVTKGEEAVYQKIISTKEKDAAAIRSALFQLTGTSAIPFGRALELANIAYQQTGVRPAFLLGIIREESNLGKNVGSGNWKTDMHPERDVPVFADITKRLGLDPDTVPVSKKPWYGWGGAMGPAQFIPSTWILYEDKIAELTGHFPPNPWDPYDAFMASAVLLRDNGAAKGTHDAERLAALRYLAGWKNATKPAYAFYGDDVMQFAEEYQRQIDILQGS